jgi:glycolate oxidase FAD binding subunit
LADALASASSKKQKIWLGSHPSACDVSIDTRAMTKVLQYEPRDLTISVEAGIRYWDLANLLAANQQMIPLDPPWADRVTVAGVLGANLNGSRRRLYGTARDLVIGMTFATLEGKLVQSGGMVVKNVAGLDMAKLLIGSFGTLAAIATVNFKLNPIPKESRTLGYSFASATEAFGLRDRVLKGQVQPAALDLLNPAASARLGLGSSWNMILLAVAAVERFEKEYPGAKHLDDVVWTKIREFTPVFLGEYPDGKIARCSTTHMGLKDLVTDGLKAPVIARAASGVAYLYGDVAVPAGTQHVYEYAPAGVDRWPTLGSDFAVMQRLKAMFDPEGLLNKGALYGRI